MFWLKEGRHNDLKTNDRLRGAFRCILDSQALGRWRGWQVGGRGRRPQGPMVMKFDLKAEGESLTGTVGSELISPWISSGSELG